MSVQLWALAAAGAVVLVAASLELWRSRHARAGALGLTARSVSTDIEPYILYFTGENCSVCRTHQEPALSKLAGVRIDKVDAIVERELADRFHVYTLPTTVVMSGEGRSLHVNYGYAPATKLQRQLADARIGEVKATATA
ncbi:MAG: thioredoxin family protein [Candidatus Dormiibacterota bacterium]